MSVTAPVDPRLPGGGGYTIGGLYDLNPSKFGVPADNYFTFASNVGEQIENWHTVVESYSGDEQVVTIRGKELHTKLTKESLSGNKISRVALPKTTDHGELGGDFGLLFKGPYHVDGLMRLPLVWRRWQRSTRRCTTRARCAAPRAMPALAPRRCASRAAGASW